MSQNNSSYLNKPMNELSDKEFIYWYILFCNGADFKSKEAERDYEEFKAELQNRSKEVQDKIKEIDEYI